MCAGLRYVFFSRASSSMSKQSLLFYRYGYADQWPINYLNTTKTFAISQSQIRWVLAVELRDGRIQRKRELGDCSRLLCLLVFFHLFHSLCSAVFPFPQATSSSSLLLMSLKSIRDRLTLGAFSKSFQSQVMFNSTDLLSKCIWDTYRNTIYTQFGQKLCYKCLTQLTRS